MKYKIEEVDNKTFYILVKYWIFPWQYYSWPMSPHRAEFYSLEMAKQHIEKLVNPQKQTKKYHYVVLDE